MNTKTQFLTAVKILAPSDTYTQKAAQTVREDTLPNKPGGAALEFVAIMEKLKPALIRQRQRKNRRGQRTQAGCESRACSSAGEVHDRSDAPTRNRALLLDQVERRLRHYQRVLGQLITRRNGGRYGVGGGTPTDGGEY